MQLYFQLKYYILLILSYVSNVSFFLQFIVIIAGAMTKMRDEICSISVVVFVTDLIFGYALCGHLLFYVCLKMSKKRNSIGNNKILLVSTIYDMILF